MSRLVWEEIPLLCDHRMLRDDCEQCDVNRSSAAAQGRYVLRTSVLAALVPPEDRTLTTAIDRLGSVAANSRSNAVALDLLGGW